MSPIKEVDYYTYHYQNGRQWYLSSFRNAAKETAIGEASPSYTAFTPNPLVADRIASDLPHAKLIYIVRNPLHQLESAWMQDRRMSGRWVSHNFSRWISKSPDAISTANYLLHYRNFRRHYAEDAILVLRLEELRRSPCSVLDAICKHLEVDNVLNCNTDSTAVKENASNGQLVDTHISRLLRRTPGFVTITRLAPDSLLATARKLFKRPMTGRPVWSQRAINIAKSNLQDNTQEFIKRMGWESSCWPMDTSAVQIK